MNAFGEFLYTLRKEKCMTQAELASALNVTNKAVSKWETGEAMPETSLLLPIAEIFGVSVDELLKGERNEKTSGGNESFESGDNIRDQINDHIFTRGKNDPPKTLLEKICGAVCGGVFFACLTAYLLLGALADMWHPYWLIVVVGALSCGIVGIIFDLCNRSKREAKIKRGENPYTGGACGIIILTCVIAYLFAGVFTGLWHPLWVIIAAGAIACFAVGAAGDIFTHNKK